MKPAVLLSLIRGSGEVARALLARADLDLILPQNALPDLADLGRPLDSLERCMTEASAGKIAGDLAPRLQHALGIAYSDAYAADFPDVVPSAWGPLRKAFTQVVREHAFVAALTQDAFRGLQGQYDLAMLVLSDAVLPQSRALIALAREAGLPTLQIQHGVMCGAQLALRHGIRTDYACVHSEHEREAHASFGVDPARIHVTGNPRWDRLCRPPLPHVREQAHREWQLDSKRPTIVYAMTDAARLSAASTAYPRHHIDNAAAVLHAYVPLARKYPEWQFVIRPRPVAFSDTRPLETVLAEVAAAGLPNVTIDRLPVYDSLCATDVCLCTQSNIGIEAILLGLPVVNVNLAGAGDRMYREGLGPTFDEDDAVLHATSAGEIEASIEAALTDSNTREMLLQRRVRSIRKFNHSLDGKATERVTSTILQLLEENGVAFEPSAIENPAHAAAEAALAQGETLFAAGRYAEARLFFARAVAANPNLAIAWNNLGTTQYTLGNLSEAWSAVNRAFHLDPFLESVRENLQALAALQNRAPEADRLLRLFSPIE